MRLICFSAWINSLDFGSVSEYSEADLSWKLIQPLLSIDPVISVGYGFRYCTVQSCFHTGRELKVNTGDGGYSYGLCVKGQIGLYSYTVILSIGCEKHTAR